MPHPVEPPSGLSNGGLAALLAPSLDPLFSRPVRREVDSAWYGHLPFAAWLVRALQPALLVELGTRSGVSYAGFCESVISSGLSTRCYAVDQWIGDEPGPEGAAFAELTRFHDARYNAFSRLLHMPPGNASARFEDGSVDLLHVYAHRAGDVARTYAQWVPKLSPRAVLLLHGTNNGAEGTEIRRFWMELRTGHPGFEFLHGDGLGVLAPGEVPPALRPLFALDADPVTAARLRDRLALLGERWEADHARVLDARAGAASSERARAADALAAELRRTEADRALLAAEADGRGRALDALGQAHDRLRDALATTKAERPPLVPGGGRAASRPRRGNSVARPGVRRAGPGQAGSRRRPCRGAPRRSAGRTTRMTARFASCSKRSATWPGSWTSSRRAGTRWRTASGLSTRCTARRPGG